APADCDPPEPDAARERTRPAVTRETAPARYRAARLEHPILAYHEAHPGHKRKGRLTPWGEIEERAQQPEYRRDETALRAWAERSGYIRRIEKISEEVDWTRLKAECAVVGNRLAHPEHGHVDGVEVIPRQPLR